MKVYETSQIRNVVLLGHGGSGKTTIAEAMAFVSGAITKMGNVTAGNTISDYDKEEQKRGFSISTSLIPIEYTDKDNGPVKLNILDTPKELLYWYKKRLKNDRTALYLAMLGFLICDQSFWFDVFNMDKGWIIAVTMFKVLLVVAIIAVFILPYFDDIIVGEFMTRRDEDIIDRLEDLVEKK